MNIPAVALSGTQSAEFTVENPLDRTAFLSLLLAQLSNQDPLEPTKDQDFIAQLAQFSSLERLEEISASIQELVALNQKLQASQSLDTTETDNPLGG